MSSTQGLGWCVILRLICRDLGCIHGTQDHGELVPIEEDGPDHRDEFEFRQDK